MHATARCFRHLWSPPLQKNHPHKQHIQGIKHKDSPSTPNKRSFHFVQNHCEPTTKRKTIEAATANPGRQKCRVGRLATMGDIVSNNVDPFAGLYKRMKNVMGVHNWRLHFTVCSVGTHGFQPSGDVRRVAERSRATTFCIPMPDRARTRTDG